MKVKFLDTLMYYDGPLIVVVQCDNGDLAIAYLLDDLTEEGSKHVRWIYAIFPGSLKRIQSVREGTTTLFESQNFLEEGYQYYTMELASGMEGEWFDCVAVSKERIFKDGVLSESGTRLNSYREGYPYRYKKNKRTQINNKKGRHKDTCYYRRSKHRFTRPAYKFKSIKQQRYLRAGKFGAALVDKLLPKLED